MTGKELKRMSRRELIELIYEMKLREVKLEKHLAEANEKLADKALAISQAGSIAEAAIAVNGVFQAAQAAADQYLEVLKGNREEIIAQAREQEREILEATRLEAEKRLQEADSQIAANWEKFKGNVQRVLEAHPELRSSFQEQAEHEE